MYVVVDGLVCTGFMSLSRYREMVSRLSPAVANMETIVHDEHQSRPVGKRLDLALNPKP